MPLPRHRGRLGSLGTSVSRRRVGLRRLVSAAVRTLPARVEGPRRVGNGGVMHSRCKVGRGPRMLGVRGGEERCSKGKEQRKGSQVRHGSWIVGGVTKDRQSTSETSRPTVRLEVSNGVQRGYTKVVGCPVRRLLATAMVLTTGGLVLGWGCVSPVSADENAGTTAFFSTRVEPILQRNCFSCHGGMNHRGGFNMQTRAGMLKGGKDGVAVVPGDPAKSLLVMLMRHEGPADDPMPMPPPPRAKVSDADIAVVEQWVRAGAMMPDDVPKP